MPPITIVDIIVHRHKYGTQTQVVLDRMPHFVFERRDNFLIGHDAGVFAFYRYEKPGPTWKAFAGREFDIPMMDGSIIHASGQWWDTLPVEFAELTYSPGYNTVEGLQRCYVFFGGGHFDRELLDTWLIQHEPSNNYHKYDKRHKDFGKHRIVSPWEDAAA